ncbi:acyltransferase [Mucilaginibacter robiniae]|uniref:Acyltransferase n=1 Tax=Mucilaginibacter robiniae TaxID=2728022 RepID=A0A7L5E2K5_9SPHI|nr:acyltransferase [Mucilaginibacter robiniae]QJD95854.1 acyltransferase [Mucilaginibacter robiniae]
MPAEENLINDKPQRKNYDFVDHIRCLAMMAIVAEHSLNSYVFPNNSAKYWAYLLLTQISKFGTIAFFLLAGFLIGDKFTDYTPGQYLKRRFSNTFGPWLFWSVVYILCFIINLHVKENMYHDGRFNLTNILEGVRVTYLYTNYWFIINFMVSITLLLIFKNYLYNPKFGLLLLSFTTFYCINIHYEWVDPSHTIAILGFVFFLWLGAQLRKHWVITETRIQMVSYPVLIGFVLLTYAVSIFETVILKANHSLDPYNTIRFSNVLYSLAMFALLLKVKRFSWLNYLKPRDTTFGIYLIHFILVTYAIPEIFRPLHLDVMTMSLIALLAFKLFSFVLVYGITWGLVMLINKTWIKRIVGN